jgi:hypothetical protein
MLYLLVCHLHLGEVAQLGQKFMDHKIAYKGAHIGTSSHLMCLLPISFAYPIGAERGRLLAHGDYYLDNG